MPKIFDSSDIYKTSESYNSFFICFWAESDQLEPQDTKL